MVTDVEPTKQGVQATLSIDNRFKIPVDASANVIRSRRSASSNIDLVSDGNRVSISSRADDHEGHCAQPDRADVGRRGSWANGAAQEKIASLLDETSQAVGGLGPTLHRWSTRRSIGRRLQIDMTRSTTSSGTLRDHR